MSILRAAAVALALVLPTATAHAQSASIAFGERNHDPNQPIEVSSDSLTVNQDDGSAVFEGNVVVVQGDLRLSAGEIRIEYSEGEPRVIDQLVASGGVTLVRGAEAAEAAEAVYSIDGQSVVMTGDVLLTQGQSAISGDRLVVDLRNGTGVVEGRVRTILRSGDN